MVARRLLWALAELLLFGGGIYLGSGWLLGVGAMALAVPLLALPMNLYLRSRLKWKLTGGGSLHKGDWGTLRLELENPSALPVALLRCCVTGENPLTRETSATFLPLSAAPRKGGSATLEFRAMHCGRIRFQVEKARLYDPFGLIGLRVDGDSKAYALVQPDTFPMDVELAEDRDRTEDSELYSPYQPGDDPAETFQLRDYVPGDSPRRVHWKLSGKFDKLIVKDPALPVTRKVLIFWERTGDSREAAKEDAQVEVLVTLCRALLDRNMGFVLSWNDIREGRCVAREVQDMEEFVAVLPRVLMATGQKKGPSGVELLLQTRPELLCGHMVYLAQEPQPGILELCRWGRTTVLLCGNTHLEGAKCFTPGDYGTKLTNLEI